MSEETENGEGTKNCVYDDEKTCNALKLLTIEFKEPEHRSLVYGTLLPAYCTSCPHLKLLESGY